MDVLDSLSPAQRETLASFQAITNTDDLDTSVTVLNSTDWNLEVSAPSSASAGCSHHERVQAPSGLAVPAAQHSNIPHAPGTSLTLSPDRYRQDL